MNKGCFFICMLLLGTIRLFGINVSDTGFSETPVVLETASGNIYGTLTTPPAFSKGPVVLIIAGSGPTDRDGNNPMMKNNSLKQVAQQFAGAGIASLRFDKRGIGASAASMKKEEDLRFDDYVNDVKDWIAFLKKDARFSKVIIAGHSEGSLIGMIAANGHADQFISIAGAGQPAGTIIRKQLSAQPKQVTDIATPILDSLEAGHTVSNVSPMLYSIFRPSVQPYMISWFRYNPAEEIRKLTIPALILQGSNDLQVSADDASMLADAKKDAWLYLILGMNHVLKVIEGDRIENMKSYNDPALPISEDLMKYMIEFIRKGK